MPGWRAVFKNLRLFQDLTALDNVLIGQPRHFGEEPFGAIFRPLHTARALRRRRDEARAILAHVGVAARAGDFVRNLSYGEQKLLSIARILATGAEFLLLDEPTSGLSGAALDSIIALLRRLQDDGKTLLVVEHNTRVVQQIADEVLFPASGTIDRARAAGRDHRRSRIGENLFRRCDLVLLQLSNVAAGYGAKTVVSEVSA